MMSGLRMLKTIFHLVFKHPPQEIGYIGERIGHHRSNCDPCLELDEAAQWVYVSIKSTASLLVAVKNNWLSKTERHGRLGVFAIALAFTSAIDKRFRTLHHQALD